MRRLLSCAGLAFVWLVLCGQGPNPDETPSIGAAESLLDSGAIKEALEIYQKHAASDKGDDRLKALYRVAETQGLTRNYQGATKTLDAVVVPDDPLWRARFLTLKAELWRESVIVPGAGGQGRMPHWISPGKKGEGAEKFLQAMKVIDDTYEALRALRSDLLRAPLSAEAFFVDLEDVDLQRYPTWWDFIVHRWTDYLLRERPRSMYWMKEDLPSTDELLSAGLPAQVEPLAKNPSVKLAAALMADAAAGREQAHLEAAGHWQIRRIAEFSRSISTSSRAGDKPAEIQVRDHKETAVKALTDARAALAFPSAKAEAGFQTASLLQSMREHERALKICAAVEAEQPGTRGARWCARTRDNLSRVELSLEEAELPDGRELKARTQNLRTLHCRLYQMLVGDSERLLGLDRRAEDDPLTAVTREQPATEAARRLIRELTPVHAWTTAIALKDEAQLREQTSTVVTIPNALPGLYYLVVSADDRFDPDESRMAGLAVNRTSIVVVDSFGIEGRETDLIYDPDGRDVIEPVVHRLYVLDGATGSPVKDAKVDYTTGDCNTPRVKKAATGADGVLEIRIPVLLEPEQRSNLGAHFAARKDGGCTFSTKDPWGSFEVPIPGRLFIETDRPAYRPGDVVQIKVTALMQTAHGYAPYQGKKSIAVELQQGRKVVCKQFGEVDAAGSIAVQCPLEKRNSGQLRVAASIHLWGKVLSEDLRVPVLETMRAPGFTIKIQDDDSPRKAGDPLVIRGEVRTYAGAPVKGRAITMRLYEPSDDDVWSGGKRGGWTTHTPSRGRHSQVALAEATSGDDGGFTASLETRRDSKQVRRLVVIAWATDDEGNPVMGRSWRTVSPSARAITVSPAKYFFSEGEPVVVMASVKDLTGAAVKERAAWVIETLKPEFDHDSRPMSLRWTHFFPTRDRLDSRLGSLKPESMRAEGALAFDKHGSGRIRLPVLGPGIYRVSVSMPDAWPGTSTQAAHFIVGDRGGGTEAVPLGNVTLPDKEFYAPGETARVLIGSKDLDAPIFVELWHRDFLISRAWVEGKGVRTYSFTVPADRPGRIQVHWTGIQHFMVHGGKAVLKVQASEKELKISMTRDKAKDSWLLKVSDQRGRPVDGEASVTLYDRALDYFNRPETPWTSTLHEVPAGHVEYTFTPMSYRAVTDWKRDTSGNRPQLKQSPDIREPRDPALRVNRSQFPYFPGRMRGHAGNRPAAAVPKNVPQPSMPSDHHDVVFPEAIADNAVFIPKVMVKNGKATVTAPLAGDREWHLRVQFLAKDARSTSLDGIVDTRNSNVPRAK